MHPPLHRPHPECEAFVEALTKCHKDHPYAKFAGVCSNTKAALDICFRAEKHNTRSANIEKARSFEARFQEAKARKEARNC